MSNILQDRGVVLAIEAKARSFVICDGCYWCASALDGHKFDHTTCPICEKPVALMPISNDATYKFNYNPSTGVELEFY